jgi:hypothetical protein
MYYISEDQVQSAAQFMNGKIQFKVCFNADKCYFLQQILRVLVKVGITC